MDAILASLCGITVGLLVVAVFKPNQDAAEALRVEWLGPPQGQDVLSRSFAQRVGYPLLNRTLAIAPVLRKLDHAVEERLEANGASLDRGAFLAIWACSGLLIPAAFFALLMLSGHLLDARTALAVGVWAAIGVYVPWSWLRRRSERRRALLAKTLPDAMDLLVTNLEAGLGLQAALMMVADKSHGPLADEFDRVVREVSVGRPRAEAFNEMAQRSGAVEMRLFSRAMLQAEQTGIPIARVLRTHSREIRERRRVKARDQAAKLPVKMVIATIFFMFPTLFLLMIGPVALNVIDFFRT